MKNRMLGSLAVAMLISGLALAAGSVTSGPQVGKDIPGAFHPQNVTGEQAGDKYCLV